MKKGGFLFLHPSATPKYIGVNSATKITVYSLSIFNLSILNYLKEYSTEYFIYPIYLLKKLILIK